MGGGGAGGRSAAAGAGASATSALIGASAPEGAAVLAAACCCDAWLQPAASASEPSAATSAKRETDRPRVLDIVITLEPALAVVAARSTYFQHVAHERRCNASQWRWFRLLASRSLFERPRPLPPGGRQWVVQ